MKRLYPLLLILIAWLPVSAQVNVSIQILPPYPTKITDYASRPQLMVISVTNSSTTRQRIQLRGAVTGDNGVELRVCNTYKSTSPIELGPGDVRMLNGADLKYFFDYTKIDYKGITQNEFISKNGLPEGSYRFCIRAYNYDTNAPVSADEPVGCSNTFTISSLEPPMLISPAADAVVTAQTGQNVVMQWTTPPGTSPEIVSSVRYRIRMVEIMGNRNPNDAIRSATQPYFFEKEVVGNAYVYNAADPQLTPGRRYSWMVEAFDPFNNTPFRNNGRSEVRAFTYGTAPVPPTPLALQSNMPLPVIGQVVNTPDCSCKAQVPTGASANNLLKTNSVVSVGLFKMTIIRLNQGSANNEPVSGEGTIGLPFIGSVNGAKLKVTFTGLDVNAQLVMKNGNVEGMLSENANPSMIPTADAPGLPALQVTPQNAKEMQTYLAQYPGQMLNALKSSANAAGFKLPIGISTGPVTLAVARVHFDATQGWFDAIGAVDIPDGGANNTLALSGKGICIGNGADFCKDGQVFVVNDFRVNDRLLLRQGTNNTDDPGTSITFKGDGTYNFSISGEYTFTEGILRDKQSNQPLTATLTAETATGWTDWLARIKMPDFYVDGMQSISFSLGNREIWYDHSDFKNPAGMPAAFKSPDAADPEINIAPNLWQGFYIPEIDVQLPAIIKNMLTQDKPVTIAGQNLIYDNNNGFTGSVTSKGTVLELLNGSMGGWYASVDNVNLQFFKSAFKASSMTGKVVLPASKNVNLPQNQLSYSATLTSSSQQGLAYEFKVDPTHGELNFDALFMRVKLTEGTAIRVKGSTNEELKADMNMNGELSIINNANGTKIAGIGKLSLPYLKFSGLKFQTYDKFLNTDDFKFELTSGAGDTGGGDNPGNSSIDYIPEQNNILSGPAASEAAMAVNNGPGSFSKQQNLGGFDFSLKSHGLTIQNGNVVFSLTGGVSLAAGPMACQADGTFSLLSGIKKTNGRIVWNALDGRVDSIALGAGAALGPLRIKGAIRYYNKPTEEGFIGALETGIGGLLTVNMRAQFGSMFNTPQGDYKYFSFNALCDFGQTGITFAPPIPLAFYGFGGGIFYNMKIDTKSLPAAANVPVKTKTQDVDDKDLPSKSGAALGDPMALLDQNPSGIVLTPNKGTFGGEATVLFGLTSRNTLDADATLSLTFTESGGLANVHFRANARLLTDVSKPLTERRAASTGAGEMIIDINPAEGNAFLASLDMELGVPHVGDKALLYARGGGEFRYNNGNDWSLKIGSPRGTSPGPNTLTILNFLTGTSYFEVGTNIDDMPGIDPDIAAIVSGGRDKTKNQTLQKSDEGNREYTPSKGSGLILGGSVQLGDTKEHHFLMFYGTLFAKAGFDISLKKDQSCDNVDAAGGPGGWYARGSAYLGAQAKIGIEVNLLLVKGKFTIFDAGAAAIVQAGLPNPAWVEGTIGGYFELLDGAISSNFKFQFSMGTKCVNTNADAFGGLEIISQVTPAPSSEKVPLTSMPGVVFNVKNGGPFTGSNNTTIDGDFEFDDYENVDEHGNPKKRYFRFDRSCVTATLNGQDVTANLYSLDKDGFAFGYKSTDYLTKNTKYNFKVVAKMREGSVVITGINNLTDINYYIDYKDFVKKASPGGIKTNEDAFQPKETTFTTDDGFSAIPASEYALTLPLHSHKAVPLTDNGMIDRNKMTIETKRVINNLDFFKYPEGTTYFARIYRNGVKEGGDIPIDMRTINGPLADGTYYSIVSPGSGLTTIPNAKAHTRWTFPSPTLKPNSSYVVIVIGKTPTTQPGNVTESIQKAKNYEYGGNNLIQINYKVRTIANQLNSLRSNETIVAGFNFETSNYDTYERKMRDLQIKQLTRPEDGGALKLTATKAANKAIFNRWIKPQLGKYTITLGYNLGGFNFPIEVTLVGERFSRADLDASTSDRVFQPVYENGGVPRSNGIAQKYTGKLITDYGTDYIKLRQFIANCTGIPVSSIVVQVSQPPAETDAGYGYCYNRGGNESYYSENQTEVGGPLPTTLPQAENNTGSAFNSISTSTINLPAGFNSGLGLLSGTPVIYETFGAVLHQCDTRGQMTFTDPIQRQIDKMKNWAVNPGDNTMNPGQVMQGVSYWESVSSATSRYMNGSINQSQLQNAIQGTKKAGAGIR